MCHAALGAMLTPSFLFFIYIYVCVCVLILFVLSSHLLTCNDMIFNLSILAEKEFGHAILAFQKSITCVPGYYPAQWCLSCLSLIPDLSISEKTCDHAMSNVGREKKLHGRWEKGGYVNRVGSSRYFDDSQAGLLLRGCLALSSGELNSALSFFR